VGEEPKPAAAAAGARANSAAAPAGARSSSAADAAGSAGAGAGSHRVRRVVFLGPPNAGKGTQSAMLRAHLGVPGISTGDMLRLEAASGTPLGQRVRGIMDRGELVDDATMAEVVRVRLAQPDAADGFLLDGYPRTLEQAETLAGVLGTLGGAGRLDAVLLMTVPEDELVRRGLLRGRTDDQEDVIRERLRVYREKTEPLVGYYRRLGLLREVDGNCPVEAVGRALLAALEAHT
jgi:adenylate kinase